ncbi:MAG: SDR family NAD(P)-dependent oxidoreductase [Sphingobium sp.]
MKHWLITGAGSGLGRATAAAALGRGDRVTGTFRDPEAARTFEASAPGRAVARIGNLTEQGAPARIVAEAEADAPIDILVNNAGQVLEAWVEDAPADKVRALFDVNLLAPLAFVQAVLPAMRARGKGRILNISSGGGILGVPGVGLYSASKFALEGMSEALAQEVGSLGIAVTIVEPGAFRTNLLGRNRTGVDSSSSDYDRSSAVKMRSRIANSFGAEPGDPARFGQAMLAVADADPAPLRAALGDDAIAMALAKADAIQRDITAWREVGSGLAYVDEGVS